MPPVPGLRGAGEAAGGDGRQVSAWLRPREKSWQSWPGKRRRPGGSPRAQSLWEVGNPDLGAGRSVSRDLGVDPAKRSRAARLKIPGGDRPLAAWGPPRSQPGVTVDGDWRLGASIPLSPHAGQEEVWCSGAGGSLEIPGTQPGASRIRTSVRVGGPRGGHGGAGYRAKGSRGRRDSAGSGVVERTAHPSPGAGAPDAPSPPRLRSAPYAFPGLRHTDGFRAQSLRLPGRLGLSPPPLVAPPGSTGGALGKGSGALTPTQV